jgi:hypothetical protein
MARRTAFSIAVTLLLVGGFVGTARAQGPPPPFPKNAFQLRLGYFAPQGGGASWDSLDERYGLSASDFGGGAWGLGFLGGVSPYLEVGINVDWYQSTVSSADPYYVDEYGYPILHDTTVRQAPLGVDLRLLPGGRRPGRPVFYLGAGAGIDFWEYQEVGDFVDEYDPTLPIYFGSFGESGQSLEGRVLAGLEFPVSPWVNLTFDGRYTFSDDDPATVERDGLWMFAGVAFRF